MAENPDTVASEYEVPKIPMNPKRDIDNRRLDYLSWEDYFMAVAFLSAQRSKDPKTQVGACIVNEDNKIVGIGYNGMPIGCGDSELPWAAAIPGRDWIDTKYPYVCHAELNAILNKNSASVKGCTIYTALFPCNECVKVILQSGITRVVFMSKKNCNKPTFAASKRMMDIAGIEYVQHIPAQRKLVIDFDLVDKEVMPDDGERHEISASEIIEN